MFCLHFWSLLCHCNPTDYKGHAGCEGALCLELLKLKQFVPLKYCIQQLKHRKLKLLMQIHLSSLGKLLCRGLGKCLCTADVFRVLAQVWIHFSTHFKKRDLCLQHVLISPVLDGVVSAKVLLPLYAKVAHTLSKQWQHQAPLVARLSRLGSAVTQTCLCSQLLLWRCLWGQGSSAGCRDMFCPNWGLHWQKCLVYTLTL